MELCQQRQKQVTAAALRKCCIDPAGPTAGKRMWPRVMEGDRLLTTEVVVCFSGAGALLLALQFSSV